MTGTRRTAPRAFSRFDPRGALPRLVLGVGAGLATAALAPRVWSTPERATGAWDAGSTLVLLLAWVLIYRSNAAETRRRAAAADPGRTVVWLLVLTACAFSLGAAVLLLHRPHLGVEAHLQMPWYLSVWAVTTSWALTHTAFALRYAHLYYRDDPEGVGGLEFPGKGEPDDLDFTYFSFTVGMTFQVSDVQISARDIRRTVLVQALLSFLYNTVIVAMVLNLLVGHLGEPVS